MLGMGEYPVIYNRVKEVYFLGLLKKKKQTPLGMKHHPNS